MKDFQIELYTAFKICLILDNHKSVRAWADEHTGTTGQHVTQVTKKKKESSVVTQAVRKYVDEISSAEQNVKILKQLLKNGNGLDTLRGDRQPAGQ